MVKILRLLGKIEEGIVWVLMLEVVALAFLQVILRYVFDTALPWGEEVLRFQMVFITFFGASLAVKYDAHIGVKIFQQLLPEAAARWLKAATLVVSCVFCFILCYYSTRLALQVKMFGQTTPALEIPNFIPYMFIPVGSFLMAVRFLAGFFLLVFKGEGGRQET